MRLLVYNIRYATGTGPAFHLPLPGAGYLRSNRKILTGITEFIRAEQADVVGLIEVDTGSIRTGMGVSCNSCRAKFWRCRAVVAIRRSRM